MYYWEVFTLFQALGSNNTRQVMAVYPMCSKENEFIKLLGEGKRTVSWKQVGCELDLKRQDRK